MFELRASTVPFETLTSEPNLYLLLDGAMLDAPRIVYEHDDSPHIERLYRQTRHAGAIEASPCLAQLSSTTRLWAQASLWQDNAVILKSDAGLDQLTDHLRSLLSVRLLSGQLAYFRFYSPKWLVRLHESASDKEFAAFSGPVSSWVVWNGDDWLKLVPAAALEVRAAADEGWFSLRQSQLDAWANTEQQQFIEHCARLLDCDPAESDVGRAQRRHMASLIANAREAGLRREDHCIHYLELAWQFPNRVGQPDLQQVLHDSNTPPGTRLQIAENKLFGLVQD